MTYKKVVEIRMMITIIAIIRLIVREIADNYNVKNMK